MSIDYAARAKALVGIRFRAQGRNADGLDCVGVVASTYGVPASEVRRDYSLRGNDVKELRDGLSREFRRVTATQTRPGDVLVLHAGQRQLHLAVRTEAGFVHAHSGLRRVVETPGMPEWPLLGVYRKRKAR